MDLRALSALDGPGHLIGSAACGTLRPRRAHAGRAASPAAGQSNPRERAEPRPAPAKTAPAATREHAPADEVIEVPAEEMDLAALAELAKKVVERKPP